MITVLKRVVPTPVRRWLRRRQSDLARRWHFLRFAGNKYRCPACGAGLRDFLPLPPFYSEQFREHGWPYAFDDIETLNVRLYTCPLCDATDRERLYALFLSKYIPGMSSYGSQLILDFAPSKSLSALIRHLIAGGRASTDYRTADLMRDDVDLRVDVMNLDGLDDEVCDLFICSHVLEHVADDRPALRELRRILKPGGVGILMVPIVLTIEDIDEDPTVTGEGERWRRFGQGDHVRLYSRQGFTQRVEEAGFVVRTLDRLTFGDETFRRHGISAQSVLYIVEKSAGH